MIDLSITGGIIFGSRSRVNTDSRDFGTLNSSSLTTLIDRIIDGDPESFWHSELGDDAIVETINMSFHILTALTSQSIDMISMQKINLKNFILEFSNDGGTNFNTVPGFDFQVSTADNNKADLLKTFTPITANFLRLTMFTTFGPADDQKRLGGLFAFLSSLQLVTGGMVKYERNDRETKRSLKLGDGSRSDELIQRSAVSHEHFGAAVQFDLVSQTERDIMRGIKRIGTPFVFVPQPFEIPRDVFTCLFKNKWKQKHMTQFTGAGHSISNFLDEVGEH